MGAAFRMPDFSICAYKNIQSKCQGVYILIFFHMLIFKVKNKLHGARETALPLRAVAVPEDPGSFLYTHMVAHICLQL